MAQHAVDDGARSESVGYPVTQSVACSEVQLPRLLVDNEDVVFLFLYQRIGRRIFQDFLDGGMAFRLQVSLRGYAHGKAQSQGVCIAFPFVHVPVVDKVLCIEVPRCGDGTEPWSNFFELIKNGFINILGLVIMSIRFTYIVGKRQRTSFRERHIPENVHCGGKEIVQLYFGGKIECLVLGLFCRAFFLVERFQLTELGQCRIHIVPLSVNSGYIAGGIHIRSVGVAEGLCILARKL